MNEQSAFIIIHEESHKKIVNEKEEEKRKEQKRKKTNARQRAYYHRQKDLKKNEEIKKVPKSNAERQRKFRQRNAEKSYMDIKTPKLCSNEENIVRCSAVENIENVTLEENQFHSQQLHHAKDVWHSGTAAMFCVQEKDSHSDPFAASEKDPLAAQSSSDDEPAPKRLKTFSPALNLKVYQIPAFNKALSIIPTPEVTLPKFVNNPLNLANPLALPSIQAANVVKSLHSRYSLPAKLSITPVQTPKSCDSGGGVVRYKKNGEVAKKRGPPKGYKRKPKADLSQSLNNGALLQAQNTILTSLLAATNTTLSVSQPPKPIAPKVTIVPKVKVPEGVELVEMELDPADWFPAEPYRMVFSRKKNPKWKNFPYRCEHCFKGYRVASTLLTHSGARHGCAPAALAVPCPCCPHVSARRKLHKKHLETHEGKRRRIFCVYCLPPRDPSEPYVKESEKYPFDKYPQYWYASEESLRLHKKRKHPYAAMLHYNWFNTWGDGMPNS